MQAVARCVSLQLEATGSIVVAAATELHSLGWDLSLACSSRSSRRPSSSRLQPSRRRLSSRRLTQVGPRPLDPCVSGPILVFPRDYVHPARRCR